MRDSGVGIDPSRLDQIFPPFVTGKLEEKGIGLSISRSIVEAHKGTVIGVRNEGPAHTVLFSGWETLK